MLQVNVNRRNYNSYVIIYFTWIRQSCYEVEIGAIKMTLLDISNDLS